MHAQTDMQDAKQQTTFRLRLKTRIDGISREGSMYDEVWLEDEEGREYLFEALMGREGDETALGQAIGSTVSPDRWLTIEAWTSAVRMSGMVRYTVLHSPKLVGEEHTERIPAPARKPHTMKRQPAGRQPWHAGIAAAIVIPGKLDGKEPGNEGWRTFCAHHNVSEQCGKAVLAFYRSGRRTFADYAGIRRPGRDKWSGMGFEELTGLAGRLKTGIAQKYLSSQGDVVSCLKWHMRGMTLTDSIRKTMIDKEIAGGEY